MSCQTHPLPKLVSSNLNMHIFLKNMHHLSTILTDAFKELKQDFDTRPLYKMTRGLHSGSTMGQFYSALFIEQTTYRCSKNPGM